MSVIYIDANKGKTYNSCFLEDINLREESEILFEYTSDFRSTKNIRECISDLSLKFWIDPIWKSRLILIVDELNNNAIEYWSKEWDENFIKIIFSLKWDLLYINIEVWDTWKWINTKTAEEMEFLKNHKKEIWFKNHNSIRWRGLFMIIEKIVDKLYFKNRESWWLIVWINKELKIKKD